ncbi:hypothetical protein ElyMa_003244900 [Elysia marginata]|uniref:Uncharacterized protein n=1 Tax=Elysia marginata TaxID=1093978 RepID=A0AAV4J6M7_9GAST|nr:hypothetical protein ElyMa_003244900 [Elysia marginata]
MQQSARARAEKTREDVQTVQAETHSQQKTKTHTCWQTPGVQQDTALCSLKTKTHTCWQTPGIQQDTALCSLKTKTHTCWQTPGIQQDTALCSLMRCDIHIGIRI